MESVVSWLLVLWFVGNRTPAIVPGIVDKIECDKMAVYITAYAPPGVELLRHDCYPYDSGKEVRR